MKHTIYWFTGTGNSLAIARTIAERLGEAELIQITRVDEAQLKPDSETAGIIFPIYAWGPPRAVDRFLDKIDVKPGTYVYSVCTCAGSAGSSHQYLKKRLGKRGIELSSGFILKMPSNYIVWGGAETEEKQNAKFEAASGRIDQIVSAVQEKRTLSPEGSGFLVRLLSGMIYRLSMSQFRKQDKKFTVSDKCTGCRVCERICPVDNIEFSDGKPVWKHECEQCLACIQFCPVEAINMGKKTETRKRYHHPDIKAKDLMKVESR